MKEMMEMLKNGKMKKEDFKRLVKEMFDLKEGKDDTFVEFLETTMGLKFAGKTEGEKIIEFRNAYKQVKPCKVSLQEIENKYYVLDNMLDTDKMNPVEQEYYNEMICKLEHIKETEDKDNIQRVKDIIRYSKQPKKYDNYINMIIHKKEVVEKYIQKFNKINNSNFTTEFYGNENISEYMMMTCCISKNINLAKNVCKHESGRIENLNNVTNENQIKSEYLFTDDFTDMMKFNDKINIIDVRSKYHFEFDGNMMDKLKTEHGKVYIVKFVVGDIDMKKIEQNIEELEKQKEPSKQEQINMKLMELTKMVQEMNEEKKNV